MTTDHGRSAAGAASGHSPKGGAASSTASPAKPSVPNAERGLGVFRPKRGVNGYVTQLSRQRSVTVFKGRHSKSGAGWCVALKKNGRERRFVISERAMIALISMVGKIEKEEHLLLHGWEVAKRVVTRFMWRCASGIEGSAQDAEERLDPKGESPAPKGGAQ